MFIIISNRDVILDIDEAISEKEYGLSVGNPERLIYSKSLGVIKSISDIPSYVVPREYSWNESQEFFPTPKLPKSEDENSIDSLKKQLGILPPHEAPQTIVEYKENKIYEITKFCEEEILSGFYSDARGEEEWYTNSRDDQNNIIGQATLATLNLSFVPQWKSAVENICSDFTMEQIVKLSTDGAIFKTERIKKFDLLKEQVIYATTIEEVSTITWVKRVW